MTAPADLAEVRAALDLVAQATPGPLTVRVNPCPPASIEVFDVVAPDGRIIACCCSADDSEQIDEANAAAIVAIHNAAPAIAAAVEELEDARAEIASAREQLDRLRSAVDEREGDMHMRIRAGYDKTVADAWRAVVAQRDAEIAALNRQVCRLVSGHEIDGDLLCQHHGAEAAALALLSDERAAHAETSHNLDALLTALGARVTPGGQTEEACHARRVADGMRRARELVAAREVPADVEAAIADLCHEIRSQSCDEDSGRATAAGDAEEHRAKQDLRAAIAAEIDRARADAREEFDHARRVFFEDMLQRRDITSPCQECEGYGVRAYPSTATWRRGAGGQMSTYDVCDRCWGSGDAVKHGVDLRRLGAEIERARAEGRGETKASALPPIDAAAEKMVDGLVAASRTAAGKRTAIAKAAPDVYLAPWEAEDLLKRIGNTYDLETTAGRNRADAAMRRALDLLGVSAPSAPAPVARPISEWHEDMVGWLLAMEPNGAIVEYERDEPEKFAQIEIAPGKFWRRRAWADGAWWSWCDVSVIDADVIKRPARLVPASEADADPASRGPIGGGSPPNPHPDGCHTTDVTAPRDCASDGHHECSSCKRKIGGGS